MSKPPPVADLPSRAAPVVPGHALRAVFAAPLRPALIAQASDGAIAASDIEVALDTGSTNTDLLARARAAAPTAPLLRAALHQTAGRGRLGRRWHAAPGSALLFSVALPLPASGVPTASTLVAGVALAEALATQAVAVALKWPNDLLLDGRKLGGLLAELAIDRAGARTLVLGVGINLWLDAAAAGSIGRPAAALGERIALETLALQREAWIGRLCAALLAALRDAQTRGFVPYQPRFMQRFAWLGEPVQLVEHGACVAEGRALGVDGEGRLLVERAGRISAIASGELSLQPAPSAATTRAA